MFSLDSFYKILSRHLLEPVHFESHYFTKFGSTDVRDLDCVYDPDIPYWCGDVPKILMFYDQEPIYVKQFMQLYTTPDSVANETWHSIYYRTYTNGYGRFLYFQSIFHIIANSEHSNEKNDLFATLGLSNWYYFFHGFAALDWFRNIRYLPPRRSFTHLFICFNNLHTKKRNYRLNLVARLFNEQIMHCGLVSLNPNNLAENIREELFSNSNYLSKEAKKLIYQHLTHAPRLTIDTDSPHGALSAFDDLDVLSQGLFHIVTETIFYDEKLHLTEKVFKPIVARRPFFLVAAPNNLAYLRSYGFRTFDRWIDESYDQEQDPDRRLDMIVKELKRLSMLDHGELDQMYNEMQEIIEYNFNWFWVGFRKTIVNELVDNYRRCLIKFNAGKDSSFCNYVDYSQVDFENTKLVLSDSV